MARTLFQVLCSTLLLIAVVATPMAAQESGARAVFSFTPSPDPLNPQPSEWGLTGLWKVLSAETPPYKSFGTSGWYDRINRNPGWLTISTTGASGFFSPHDRVELGVQVNTNRRILARRLDQLSYGQATMFALRHQGCPGCPLLAGPLNLRGTGINQLRDPRNNALSGAAGYYNLLPFVNRGLQTGVGEVVVSGKINLLSEARGEQLGLAIRPWVGIPTRSTRRILGTGAQTSSWQAGIDLLLSKNIGDAAGVHFNGGFAYVQNPHIRDDELLNTQNVLPLRFGVNIPRTSRFQVVGEVIAEAFVGDKTPNTTFDAASPVDGTIGFRVFPWIWLAISAGYRHPFNQSGGDKHGFVFMLSSSAVPVTAAPAPVPPTVSCSADQNNVTPGTVVRLTATASTTTGRPLSYAWSAPQGRIEGSGPEVRFDTTGLAPGNYTATVRVSDGADGFADCTVSITVVAPPPPPPQHPPTASCSVDRGSVMTGEMVTFRVTAGSPDNRPLSYQWSISPSGRLEGAGTSVRLDTTGLSPGTYTASVRVTDDRGLSAECSSSVTVSAPPPRPEMSKLNTCNFRRSSARVDNVCKAVLDDVALRLRSEAEATVVVVGYSAAKEPAKAKLSEQRARNVKTYLVKDKGIAADRVQLRAVTDGTPQVEIYLVPRGASYTGPGEAVTEQPAPAVRPRGRAAKPAGVKPPAGAPPKAKE